MSKKFIIVEASGAYAEELGFGTGEFIATSAGAADAGKPVVLGANGKLDSSIVDASVVDHDSTSGVAASVAHNAFPLLLGTRAFTGVQSYSSALSITADENLVHKKYVDDIIAGERWEDGVIARLSAPPASPVVGDRYIVIATATGAWLGSENSITEWNGSSWDFFAPSTGWKVSVANELDGLYLYSGSVWEKKLFESTTASTGLTKVGQDIQIASATAGAGLGFTAGVLSVNVDDSSLEIATDTLQVKELGITNAMLAGSIADSKLVETYIKQSEVDDITIEFSGGNLNVKDNGINDLKIDFGTGLNQVNASDLPIIDAAGLTAASDVESALAEIYTKLKLNGVTYTVGTGGVSKGDLVYISGNDTVNTYSTITTFHKAIGLASETEAAAGTVVAMANDTRLEGVISGATAGDVYYWDGSSLVNSIPTTSSAYVIQCGVAINGTDLAVEVKSVKKNI